jgi:hypothetical protein
MAAIPMTIKLSGITLALKNVLNINATSRPKKSANK